MAEALLTSRHNLEPGVTPRMLAYSTSPNEDCLADRVIAYIDRNYANSISLRDVAQAFGYSPCHLTHTFSRITGTPVTAWIIKRRIVAAQQLLAESNASVATACEAVGFHDLCYFTRQFVRHVGMTPGRFRASRNGNARASQKNIELRSLRREPESDLQGYFGD